MAQQGAGGAAGGTPAAPGAPSARGGGGGGGGGSRNNTRRNNNRHPTRQAFKSPIPELADFTFTTGSTGYKKTLEGVAAWATGSQKLPQGRPPSESGWQDHWRTSLSKSVPRNTRTRSSWKAARG